MNIKMQTISVYVGYGLLCNLTTHNVDFPKGASMEEVFSRYLNKNIDDYSLRLNGHVTSKDTIVSTGDRCVFIERENQ